MKLCLLLSKRPKWTLLGLLDEVDGSSEALHVLGTGGGTRAGITPAFDTPIVRPEKKLTLLKIASRKYKLTK